MDISGNKLQDLAGLKGLSNLTVSFLLLCRYLPALSIVIILWTKLIFFLNLKFSILFYFFRRLFEHLTTYLSSVKSVGKMKCLEEIYLSSNRLTDLSHIVGLFPALQILDVGHNHIETWQQVVRLFPYFIVSRIKIREIRWSSG